MMNKNVHCVETAQDKSDSDHIEDKYSLSPLQQGMLFHTLREKGVGMYISQAVSRYENLDCDALRKAWQLIVDRHAILRTSFHWDDPENPYQIVHRRVDVPFFVEDWRGISPSEQNSRLRKFQRDEREQGFDLTRPALIRITVIQVTRRRWLCVNSNHHIILDGWSGGLLANEVGRAYQAYKKNRSPAFDPPVPFGDYIRWIDEQDLEAADRFWQTHLASVELPTPLPAERELLMDKARVRMHVEYWDIKFDDQLTARVERFARHCKVTLQTLIQSVWPLLLSRYCGRRTVIFGFLVSGRPPELKGVENIVGMFLNTVPFCVTVDDTLTVGEWLRRMHSDQAELQRYEHSPLMRVQQLSKIPGGISLFNSIVARKDVTQVPTASRRGGQSARQSKKSEQTTFQQNYPLLLNITAKDGIELKLTYDARKFRSIDVSRIMEQLRYLMLSLIEDSEKKLGTVQAASPEELHQLEYGWNDTGLEIDGIKSIDQLLTDCAETMPDKVAAMYHETRLTFRDLTRQVEKIARHLHDVGLGSTDCIVVDHSSPLMRVLSVLAVLRIGARCLPLDGSSDSSLESPTLPCCCHALINDRGNDVVLGDHSVGIMRILPDAGERQAGSTVGSLDDEIQFDDDSALLILRGAGQDYFGVDNQFLATRFLGQPIAFLPDTDLALWHPGDSVAFYSEIFACWQAHGAVHFIDPPRQGSLSIFCEALLSSDVNRVSLTPTLLTVVLQDAKWAAAGSHIRTWCCSGEPLWAELCNSFAESFPESRLVHIFSTDRHGACLAWEMPRSGCDTGGPLLGTPLPNVRAYLSTDGLKLSPVGGIGELLLAWDDVEQAGTRKKIVVPHKSVSDLLGSEHIFHTGVLARRWNDGAVEYVGQVDEHVNPDLDTISALLRAEREIMRTPLVELACVLNRGKGGRTAFIMTSHEPFDLSELHRRICRVVSRGLSPTHYVVLTAFPLDRFGRIHRRQLQEMEHQEVSAAEFDAIIKKPKSELESIIATVWMEVLRIDKISTDDNFFELGGHSLAATKATARLTKILKSDIHLKGIFEAPTVSLLADWIQSDRHKEELPFSIQVADRGSDAPLTFTQQQLWVLAQLFPQFSMYTIPSNAILNGPMDIDILHRCFLYLMERHEILRTVFVSQNGEPRQVVNPAPDKINLEFIDLTHLPEDERMEKARWYGAQLGKISWDMENGPLIRPQLVKLTSDRHLLNTAFHHIIADGPSMGVYIKEMGSLYEAYTRGRTPKLPELSLQFSDFAVWERENVKGDLFQRQLGYWRENLDGAPLLEIPTDFPRPAVHGFVGKKVKFEIVPEIGLAFRQLAREEGATVFMGLLAVYQLLLHKYSGQVDIVVGSAMTNRIRVELERLIGLFVNTVALRTDLSGDPTFRELLNRVKICCLGAFANMDLPFEETIAQIQPHRDLSRQGSPLFQFMLIHNPTAPGAKLAATDNDGPVLQPGDPHNDTGHANFDLLLATRDTPEGLIKITMSYDVELFRRETIDRMIEHFQLLFKKVTASPDLSVSRLDLVGDAERQEILTQWNGGEIKPSKYLVHQIISSHAVRYPDHVAVCCEDKKVTYAELDQRSNQLATLLHRAGVQLESMVAVCLPRTDDLIVGILAVLKAGGAFVPLDASYPADRIKHILGDAESRILLSNQTFAHDICKNNPGLEFIDIESPDIRCQKNCCPEVDVAFDNLVYVIFTSGSTGLPKGVMVEHHNLVEIIRSQIGVFQITRESRVLQMLSISFDAAVGEVFRTLVGGGTLYMADKDDLLPGPSLLRLLKENRITTMAISPTALGAMPDCSDDLPDLKTITVGGEACSQSIAERWGKGRRLLNAYGPTETTIGATIAVNWYVKAKPPLGHPLDGVKVYVLDDRMHLVPVGTPGELYIGGIGVTRGYLKRPELTDESFIPNPFSTVPGERIYKTGDLVRWLSNGILDFIGRIDQQVKIRGFRIELGEIENALSENPAIDHCTVTVHETGTVKRLVAYTVSQGDWPVQPSALRSFLKEKLPDYMIPAFFIPLDKIPTNHSGKVDRHALPEPDLSEFVSDVKEYVPPVDDMEKTMVDLWCRILGLQKIGVLDNFFEIGGDSISAIRVAARANDVGFKFASRDIFVYQTIRELVDYTRLECEKAI